MLFRGNWGSSRGGRTALHLASFSQAGHLTKASEWGATHTLIPSGRGSHSRSNSASRIKSAGARQNHSVVPLLAEEPSFLMYATGARVSQTRHKWLVPTAGVFSSVNIHEPIGGVDICRARYRWAPFVMERAVEP